MNLAEFKKFFLFNLIGSLIISALVAVVTVLIGEFNDISMRILLTLLMVMIHSLVSLAFIWDDERQSTFHRLSFFKNVLFILIVISFVTSLFGIWEIVPGNTIGDLYQTYFVVAFAALHGDILSKALNKTRYLDIIIYANYLFMIIVVFMLQPIIFLNNALSVMGEMYFRFLGAAGIIDGTLSILTIILYKIYIHKHPRIENPLQPGNKVENNEVYEKKRKGLSIWVWILLIYLFLQIVVPLAVWIFGFNRIF